MSSYRRSRRLLPFLFAACFLSFNETGRVLSFRPPETSPLTDRHNLSVVRPSSINAGRIQFDHSRTAVHATNGQNSQASYEYKDDCFGFITFLGGIAGRDVVFTGLFILFSLLCATGCRLRLLPADSKRNSIVNRKVPGVVAGLTLALTPVTTDALIRTGLQAALEIPTPEADDSFRMLQVSICVFSMVTAFLDIRWRDRFDYPH